MAIPLSRGAGSCAMTARAMTVPVDSVTPPGRTFPVPIMPAKWSSVPTFTSVSCVRPSACAADAVSGPAMLHGSTSGGSRVSSMPMASSICVQ